MPTDRDTPIVLSRIYTRTGDDGTTALGDMSRARKTDPRLAAYADTDVTIAQRSLEAFTVRSASSPCSVHWLQLKLRVG